MVERYSRVFFFIRPFRLFYGMVDGGAEREMWFWLCKFLQVVLVAEVFERIKYVVFLFDRI